MSSGAIMPEKHVAKLAAETSLTDLYYVRRILGKDPTKARALETINAAIRLKLERKHASKKVRDDDQEDAT